MLVARALKIGQIADGGMSPTYETMHYICFFCRNRIQLNPNPDSAKLISAFLIFSFGRSSKR